MGDIPDFLPSKYGLPYGNDWPSEPDVIIGTPFGPIKIGNAAAGLCGGMSFAARDLYEVRRTSSPIRPAGGSPGFNYLVGRLIDSFNVPGGVVQFYEWMNLPTHDTWLGPHGTSWRTIQQEMPTIRRSIDAGHPCPLGLVLVRSADPTRLGDNHQVLAWGYEDAGPLTTVKIYDPNAPGEDDVTIQFDHTNPTHTTEFECRTTGQIFGFFVLSYSPKDPQLLESPAPDVPAAGTVS